MPPSRASSRCGRGKKTPRDERGVLALASRGLGDLAICRGRLGKKTTEGFIGLRGEIAIQRANLLRLGHERLEGRFCELGLNFNHLVDGLHA